MRVTTTITFEEHDFVNRKRLQFGAILSARIRELMEKDEEAIPGAEEVGSLVHDFFIKEKLSKGLTSEEAETLWTASEAAKAKPPPAPEPILKFEDPEKVKEIVSAPKGKPEDTPEFKAAVRDSYIARKMEKGLTIEQAEAAWARWPRKVPASP